MPYECGRKRQPSRRTRIVDSVLREAPTAWRFPRRAKPQAAALRVRIEDRDVVEGHGRIARLAARGAAAVQRRHAARSRRPAGLHERPGRWLGIAVLPDLTVQRRALDLEAEPV